MFQRIGIFLGVVFLLGQSLVVATEGGSSKQRGDSSDEYELSDSEYVTPVILEQINQANLEDVESYVDALLEIPNLNPHQIGLVIDVDGALTNYSDPLAHQGPAQARGNAAQFVKKCVERGINIIVSSAWTLFEETIQRLKDIGLGDILGINEGQIQRGESDLFGTSVEYAYLGLVASVKNKEGTYLLSQRCMDIKFFRLKAFAFPYVYPTLDLKTINHWVFGDDGSDNVSLFTTHIQRLYDERQIEKQDVPGGVSVQTFLLSEAKGEATLR